MVNTEAFKRYVEVGRVVLVTKGQGEGNLAVITEIIDHNKAIIDGPSTGVPRQVIQYKYVALTPHVVPKITRAAGTSAVKKQFDASGIQAKWTESAWAKKRAARLSKAATSDFDRFNIMLLKKERRRVIGAQAAKIKA